jgi:hypothetical protein
MASPSEHVTARLAAFLGPHTARNALKTFATRTLGRAPEELTVADVPALLEALRPMLRTLLGDDSARALVDQIKKELGA